MDMITLLNGERELIMYVKSHPEDEYLHERVAELEELHEEIVKEVCKDSLKSNDFWGECR